MSPLFRAVVTFCSTNRLFTNYLMNSFTHTTDMTTNIGQAMSKREREINDLLDSHISAPTNDVKGRYRRMNGTIPTLYDIAVYDEGKSRDNGNKHRMSEYEKRKESINKIRDALVNVYINSLDTLLNKGNKERHKGFYFEQYDSTRRKSDIPGCLPPIRKRIRSFSLDGNIEYDKFSSYKREQMSDSILTQAYDEQDQEYEHDAEANLKQGFEKGKNFKFSDVYRLRNYKQAILDGSPINRSQLGKFADQESNDGT